jgi:hypothetical protein
VAAALPPGVNHCAVHDIRYGKLEQCRACRAERSATVKASSPKADTKELRLRESEYREADKFLRRIAREILDEGTAQERGLAIKMFDAAAKWARIALEINTSMLEIEHDQWLRDENMRMRGGGGN